MKVQGGGGGGQSAMDERERIFAARKTRVSELASALVEPAPTRTTNNLKTDCRNKPLLSYLPPVRQIPFFPIHHPSPAVMPTPSSSSSLRFSNKKPTPKRLRFSAVLLLDSGASAFTFTPPSVASSSASSKLMFNPSIDRLTDYSISAPSAPSASQPRNKR